MRKLISTILAGALLGTAFIAPVSTATAEPRWERGNWDDNSQWYWRHRDRDRDRGWRYSDRRDRDGDDDDDIAAGIAGFAAGALIGSLATGGSSHVDRCFARYQSYDPASNTYLGYDGYRHPCTL